MKTITVIEDKSRANRNNNMGGYSEICTEVIKELTGEDREFKGGSMSWDFYKSTSYVKTCKDAQYDVCIDFNKGTITVTETKW